MWKFDIDGGRFVHLLLDSSSEFSSFAQSRASQQRSAPGILARGRGVQNSHVTVRISFRILRSHWKRKDKGSHETCNRSRELRNQTSDTRRRRRVEEHHTGIQSTNGVLCAQFKFANQSV